MSSPHFTARFEEDDDGFWRWVCNCGFMVDGMPDMETAIDIYGEHCYEEGLAVNY